MEVLNERSTAFGLAQRTKKNLKHIELARANGADVHEVTQIVLSVLGIVIIPWEWHLKDRFTEYILEDLYANGWPRWNITVGHSKTLSDLTHMLRNATAHGHYKFSSDERDPKDVWLVIENIKNRKVTWQAQISAADLKTFCYRFLQVVENETG